MVEIQVAYLGQLRCEAKHGPSGIRLTTDAPVDNKGKGESFSPTDLVATALGTCMLTTMAIRTMDRSYPLDEASVIVKKHMTKAPPRRIEALEVSIRVPRGEQIDAEGREVLSHAAHHCPVRLSILDAIAVPISIAWS